MKARSITQRWLFNSFSVILLILIAVIVGVSLALRSYYYSSVRHAIDSRLRVVTNLLLKYDESNASGLDREIRELVENFSDRNLMELMALDAEGRPVLTSSGFELSDSLSVPDYQLALASDDSTGVYTGPLYQEEKVMAVTLLFDSYGGEFGAVRYVVSMTEIDSQLVMLILLMTLVGMGVIFFVVMSSSYFIRSIVIPVGEIGKSARKIASGNFDVRIERRSEDEIGELVDTINHMAEELGTNEKMKNDFISSVSHELRTPLTAIRGWGETLNTPGVDQETLQKGMGVILRETDRLQQMVEELLDFSRMQSGRITLNKERLDIQAELYDAELMFTERARRENITFTFDEPSDEIVIVEGDSNRLRQVFVNIIDNALKYSDSGAQVRVRTSSSGGMFSIAVSDTGIGISAEDLPKVKTKFYKGNSTRRGSGIGLAVADEIVRMHGGELNIDSRQGKGTCVTIRLPIVK